MALKRILPYNLRNRIVLWSEKIGSSNLSSPRRNSTGLAEWSKASVLSTDIRGFESHSLYFSTFGIIQAFQVCDWGSQRAVYFWFCGVDGSTRDFDSRDMGSIPIRTFIILLPP